MVLDPAHNEFVHDTHGFEGEDQEYKIGEMRIEKRGGWGQGFWHTFNAPPLTGDAEFSDVREFAGDLEVGTGFHGPNQVWTFIHLSPTDWLHQYLIERPIDENHIAIYLLCMRNCYLEEKYDQGVMDRNQYVADQDVVIVENLHPRITPDTNTKEYMLPADKCITDYREALKDWASRGWRINSEQVAATQDKVAYAIPSPARRKQKGWVLDAIPLQSADQANPKLKAAS